jgi:hypothetical protein
MSELGHQQPFRAFEPWSALPLRADLNGPPLRSLLQVSLRRHLEPRTPIRVQEDQAENPKELNGDSTIILSVDRVVISRLRDQAALRGISHAALAAALLETVVRDRLHDAVLDES